VESWIVAGMWYGLAAKILPGAGGKPFGQWRIRDLKAQWTHRVGSKLGRGHFGQGIFENTNCEPRFCADVLGGAPVAQFDLIFQGWNTALHPTAQDLGIEAGRL